MTSRHPDSLIGAGIAMVGAVICGYLHFYYSASANPSITVVLPAGAVAAGLFLISFMMEKQMAIYDREQAGKLEMACAHAPAATKSNGAQRSATVVR